MSLFSVVIPTYNRASLLPKTLGSVVGQEFHDFEIIVVDDGSTDQTPEVLQSYGDRLRVLRQENAGPGAARNLGVRESTGEYIVFLDSDDCWFPWTLATYARIIEERDRPSIIRGALTYFHDEGEIAAVKAEPMAIEVYPDYYAAGRRGLYCGSGQMAVRRAALVAVGGFTEGRFNAEDHDLVMRLGTAPRFVNVLTPSLLAYRQHPGAATRDLSRTFTGLNYLLEMERAANYPGGKPRRRDRRVILSQHVRPLTLELLRRKEFQKAWALYRQTFACNVAQGRFRYLAGFFFRAVVSCL